MQLEPAEVLRRVIPGPVTATGYNSAMTAVRSLAHWLHVHVLNQLPEHGYRGDR